MALFLEDSQKVTKRKIPVPKNYQKVFSALYDALEPNMGKNKLKNLKNLATNKTYNKKSNNSSKANGKDGNVKYVNVDIAKMRKERWPKNQLQQLAQGGQLAYNMYEKGIERARSQEKVSPVAPPKPTTNADVKPSDVKVKAIEKPSGTISYNENRIIKEYDEHKMYDYLEDYGVEYVLSQFMKNPKGKQNWGVLINPDMYAKALSEFTQFGKLVKFPTKYVYQWMGIIMKNTAILNANTALAGHTQWFPYEEVDDFIESYFNNKREIEFNDHDIKIELLHDDITKINNDINPFINENAVDKYNQTYFPWVTQTQADDIAQQSDIERITKRFGEMGEDIQDYIRRNKIEFNKKNNKFYWIMDKYELLDEIGLFDWMQMPDGSDAWSDFGLEPLFKIIKEYNEDLPPEKVLVIVNKALDVYHQRGDMASMFIQGGSKALSRIAEEIQRSDKKIFITERQLIQLKYGELFRN